MSFEASWNRGRKVYPESPSPFKENFFNSRGLNLVVYGLFYNSTVHLRSFGLRPHTLGGIRFDVDVAEPLRRRSSV